MTLTDSPTKPLQPHRRRGVLERTLADISNTLEHSLFAEEIARRRGLLQMLDPRVKVVSILFLLIAVSLSRSPAVIVALYVLTLVLARLSSVPMGFFVKRVWLFMPFFTGIVALPAFFITPGPPLAHLPFGLVITRTGAMTALFLLLRVGTSVSAAVLLVLTTPWNSVLKALGVLRVPDVFIVILGMTYRYIYLLLHTANDMLLSRKSRVIGRMSTADERRLMAASAGVLLTRSLDLSGEVYLAMQSRGFGGYPRTMDTWKMRALDWAWGAGMLTVAVIAIWLGR
jgi:cobalt/nickel transport system permease protein